MTTGLHPAWPALLLLGLAACLPPPRIAPSAAGSSLERSAAGAEAYEETARNARGRKAAQAWYDAGRLWLDPSNPAASPARALDCFRRVDLEAAHPAVARETEAWISVLSRLVSAEDAARQAQIQNDKMKQALTDAARTSDALKGKPPSPAQPR
ncbi:MAG: hypothetical protein ACT4O3_09710 [Elusimicrobiota bacterium]